LIKAGSPGGKLSVQKCYNLVVKYQMGCWSGACVCCLCVTYENIKRREVQWVYGGMVI